MTRAPVPLTAHQHALSAANMARSVSVKLTGYTTYEAACQADIQIMRAIDELKALRPIVRQLKRDIQNRQREEAEDRMVIERDKALMEMAG